MSEPFSIVCLSPQEWDAALPTNRQQIMLRAAARGHSVLFVETGAFLGRHLARLARPGSRRAVAAQLAGAAEVAPGIRVCKALNAAPWGHKRRPANAVNARLTALSLRRLVRRLPQPVVLWLYDPCAAGLIGRCGERLALYDCVDDYAEMEGADEATRQLVAEMDAESASRARIVSTTSRYLHDRHSAKNPETHLVRNVADYGHFAGAAPDPELAALPRPVVGFAGNLHPGKVDFDLLDELVRRRPDWTFVLVGPAQPAAAKRVAALARAANVRWLGHTPYEQLPARVAAFDVAAIPYAANPYTRSCFPLKLYEYLAAGKPVVASGLPELAGMEPDVALVEGAAAFEPAVERALALRSDADRERRMAIAAGNTWEGRAGRLLALVGDALEA
jgi:glycosyltransferase involved in cell wall biosynthesis